MHGLIGGDEGKTIEQFKALLTQATGLPDASHTQSGFMHQLQGQAGFHLSSGLAGPAAQQVPRSQSQVFGHQEPEADHVAGDFVGQQLPDAAFQAGRIGGFGLSPLFGAEGVNV
jgi:hypothetical protein